MARRYEVRGPRGAAQDYRRELQGPRAGAPSTATDRQRDALPPPRKALWDHNNKPGVKAPRERGGTRSLDPPAVLNYCEACRVAVNPAVNDAPFLGGRWRRLPLRRGPAPNLEYWTARRVHGGCGDRHGGDWEPLPSSCTEYPLPSMRGDGGRGMNPVGGPWECLPTPWHGAPIPGEDPGPAARYRDHHRRGTRRAGLDQAKLYPLLKGADLHHSAEQCLKNCASPNHNKRTHSGTSLLHSIPTEDPGPGVGCRPRARSTRAVLATGGPRPPE
ncbi:hypothetical protein NDU88_003527 [Pleurodeles waltl]|uniref:Uncharacterized protein n=1 Tax=Pleurodeles waltl TaxID=8319 RepID=A0AAV7TPC8_PLEWA|nr:hypothetical protein NDU88_003527 [Pleurodeles waltl]